MFNEPEYLAGQISRSWHGPAWHGPSLEELVRNLNDVTSERRPSPGSHNIREIVQHVTSWQTAVLDAISGAPMPDENWPEDWPGRGGSWPSLCEQLGSITEKLVRGIRGMPSKQLSDRVPGRDFDYRFLLSGVPQHNSYHGGQIALLKKATT